MSKQAKRKRKKKKAKPVKEEAAPPGSDEVCTHCSTGLLGMLLHVCVSFLGQ